MKFHRCAVARPRARCRAAFFLLPILTLGSVSGVWAQQNQPTTPSANPAPATPPAADTGEASVNPISTERPGYTNGTDTIPLGHLQFETGYETVRQGGVTLQALDSQSELRLPFSANAEFRVGTPTYFFGARSDRAATGFTDTSATVKWRFLEQASARLPALALIAGTTLPTGSPAQRAPHLLPLVDLEAQYNLSTLYQLQANAVYTRATDGDTGFNQYSGTISVGYNLSSLTSLFLQAYRATATGASGAPSETDADTGVTYAFSKTIQLDFSVGVGISPGNGGDHFVSLGYSERW